LILKPSFELTATSAPLYLAGRGFDLSSLRVTELAGGVSNIVLLAETSAGRLHHGRGPFSHDSEACLGDFNRMW